MLILLQLSLFNQGILIPGPLFKQSFTFKFQDKICLENILFVSKALINLSP